MSWENLGSEGAVRSRAPQTELTTPTLGCLSRKGADQCDKGLPGGAWLSYFSAFLLETQFWPHTYIENMSFQTGNKTKFSDEHWKSKLESYFILSLHIRQWIKTQSALWRWARLSLEDAPPNMQAKCVLCAGSQHWSRGGWSSGQVVEQLHYSRPELLVCPLRYWRWGSIFYVPAGGPSWFSSNYAGHRGKRKQELIRRDRHSRDSDQATHIHPIIPPANIMGCGQGFLLSSPNSLRNNIPFKLFHSFILKKVCKTILKQSGRHIWKEACRFQGHSWEFLIGNRFRKKRRGFYLQRS